MKLVIVDYGIGNLKSIQSAFEKVGVPPILSRSRDEILEADGVILPGVGAFSHGMSNLHECSLVDVLREYAILKKPLLGICLGMQMLLDESEEFGQTKGIGIIPGKVIRISEVGNGQEKVPHVSWNELKGSGMDWRDTVLQGILPQSDVYFVHSYIAVPSNKSDILATCGYADNDFCAVIKSGNIYGCQFHPEKSAENGLKIIGNFINIIKEGVANV